jgi:hypothetical protein
VIKYHQPEDPGIELEGMLGAYTFLLEIMFVMILEQDPDGLPAAFRKISGKVRDIIQRSPAIAVPTTARAAEVSDEIERQLQIFLARLASRIGE